MIIADALTLDRLDSYPVPEMNPLAENHALQEAQVVGLRLDAVTSCAMVLLDLRMALQLREPQVGVMVLRGVRTIEWSGRPQGEWRTAWTITGSVAGADADLWTLRLGLWPAPGSTLMVEGRHPLFVAGDVPGMSDTPPDFGGDEATIRAHSPAWESPFIVTHAARP